MNSNERLFARTVFKNKIYAMEGQSFENLFVRIMTMSNSNFKAVKPWGNDGDQKNDGFDASEGKYYQVFAPEDILKKKTIYDAVKKLEDDFRGLYKKWNCICPIKEYYFVINDKYKGLPPDITKKAISLGKEPEYSHLKIDTFTSSDLEKVFMRLEDNDIFDVVGFLPNPIIAVKKYSYYEKIWRNHCKGEIRDIEGTGNVRELIDFFSIPFFENANESTIVKPFSDKNGVDFIIAGSGYGKSSILHIMVLCNTINALIESGSTVVSKNSKEKLQEYEKVRRSLFGDSMPILFPVFINSEIVNNKSYNSPLDLLEIDANDDFINMINEAYNKDELLFLIDSIDEVHSKNLNAYLLSIKKLLSEYQGAKFVMASRFLDERKFPFIYNTIYIKKLNESQIQNIAKAIRSEEHARIIIERYKNSYYFRLIAENPFMLMIILEKKEDSHLHFLLKLIVNAIIRQRWKKYNFKLKEDDIVLLLGFLACKYIFENFNHVGFHEIRQFFIKAEHNLKIYGVPYDFPSDNMSYFLETLSSQSGILNIYVHENREEYIFQDRLVKCWLAANYIDIVLNESNEINDRGGLKGIWKNVNWLDRFICSISANKPFLSEDAIISLVMALVINSEERGADIQKSIVYYLACRDAVSMDETERKSIKKGFKNILDDTFGENDITNLPTSQEVKLIERMLKTHE